MRDVATRKRRTSACDPKGRDVASKKVKQPRMLVYRLQQKDTYVGADPTAAALGLESV
jgi:hypothetical protein